MVTVCGFVADTVLVVGYDVFSAAPFADYATAKFKRKVRKIYVTGGTAVADFACDLQYGARKQAIGIHNNATAVAPDETAGVPVCSLDTCWPDEKLMLVVTDAAASPGILFKVEIV